MHDLISRKAFVCSILVQRRLCLERNLKFGPKCLWCKGGVWVLSGWCLCVVKGVMVPKQVKKVQLVLYHAASAFKSYIPLSLLQATLASSKGRNDIRSKPFFTKWVNFNNQNVQLFFWKCRLHNFLMAILYRANIWAVCILVLYSVTLLVVACFRFVAKWAPINSCTTHSWPGCYTSWPSFNPSNSGSILNYTILATELLLAQAVTHPSPLLTLLTATACPTNIVPFLIKVLASAK